MWEGGRTAVIDEGDGFCMQNVKFEPRTETVDSICWAISIER